MQIKEVITTEANIISSTGTLVEAASMMSEKDIGALPVYKNDSLVGMITDRDIVVRGVAKSWPTDSPVEDLMSEEVLYCFDDQSVEEVLDIMGEQQIRRMPVLSHDERLMGVVAFADLIVVNESEKVKNALRRICELRR